MNIAAHGYGKSLRRTLVAVYGYGKSLSVDLFQHLTGFILYITRERTFNLER